MFYQNLNGAFGDDKTSSQVGDGDVTLNNIQTGYWSGTEFGNFDAWAFFFDFGAQFPQDKFGPVYGWPSALAIRWRQCRSQLQSCYWALALALCSAWAACAGSATKH